MRRKHRHTKHHLTQKHQLRIILIVLAGLALLVMILLLWLSNRPRLSDM